MNKKCMQKNVFIKILKKNIKKNKIHPMKIRFIIAFIETEMLFAKTES